MTISFFGTPDSCGVGGVILWELVVEQEDLGGSSTGFLASMFSLSTPSTGLLLVAVTDSDLVLSQLMLVLVSFLDADDDVGSVKSCLFHLSMLCLLAEWGSTTAAGLTAELRSVVLDLPAEP